MSADVTAFTPRLLPSTHCYDDVTALSYDVGGYQTLRAWHIYQHRHWPRYHYLLSISVGVLSVMSPTISASYVTIIRHTRRRQHTVVCCNIIPHRRQRTYHYAAGSSWRQLLAIWRHEHYCRWLMTSFALSPAYCLICCRRYHYGWRHWLHYHCHQLAMAILSQASHIYPLGRAIIVVYQDIDRDATDITR